VVGMMNAIKAVCEHADSRLRRTTLANTDVGALVSMPEGREISGRRGLDGCIFGREVHRRIVRCGAATALTGRLGQADCPAA